MATYKNTFASEKLSQATKGHNSHASPLNSFIFVSQIAQMAPIQIHNNNSADTLEKTIQVCHLICIVSHSSVISLTVLIT